MDAAADLPFCREPKSFKLDLELEERDTCLLGYEIGGGGGAIIIMTGTEAPPGTCAPRAENHENS